MRAGFKKTKLMKYRFYLHFFFLLELQNIKSNEAKNIILDMYSCVPYGCLGYIIDPLFLYKKIDRFILYLIAF